MPIIEPVMESEYVVEFIRFMQQNNIEVYIDGGWAVDAVLGEQTRKHEDLDIALPHKYVPLLRKLLEEKGFKNIPRDDTRDCNFVLGDEHGHLIDIHSYTFDENGENIFGIEYKPHHLIGTGFINGFEVNCVPADVLVKFHTGYKADENDYHDVSALCNRFNIALPEDYEKFL